MSTPLIAYYQQMIRRFLCGERTALEFEAEFLAAFKGESRTMSNEVFLVLDALFSAVDAFCEDDMTRGGEEISESQLRLACANALAALDRIKREGGH